MIPQSKQSSERFHLINTISLELYYGICFLGKKRCPERSKLRAGLGRSFDKRYFLLKGEYITSNGKSSDGDRDPLSAKRSFGFTKSRDNGTSVENFKMTFPSFIQLPVTFKDHKG